MTACGRLLIAEDEPILRVTIGDALKREGWQIDVVEDGAKALACFEEHRHEVIVADLMMPRLDGLELLRRAKALEPDTTVVIITAHGSIETAVEAMKHGAADFITKPFSMVQLVLRLKNLCSFRMLKEQNVRLQEQLERRHSFGNIIGKSKRMLEVFELIKVVTDSDANVLVQGESGTGKELVASALHFNSNRRRGPYVPVSCTALPESLLESELFGYERGAFTGATERRIGRFEAASGGTLFLDEIGELPLSFQVKLLRVLQERKIERLGSQRSIDVNVRVVSASLRPLDEEIREGLFREDLFFRINTVTIHLPALRERREDIPILARAFLDQFARERGKRIEGFADEVLQAFDMHHWSGNVRELRNVVERAALFAKKPQITLGDLPTGFRTDGAAPDPAALPQASSLQEAVERAEIEAIRAALAQTQGRRSEAASLLGVSRKTLWEKSKHYALESEGDVTPIPLGKRS